MVFIFSNYDKRNYTGQSAIAVELMKWSDKEFRPYSVSNTAEKKIKENRRKLAQKELEIATQDK